MTLGQIKEEIKQMFVSYHLKLIGGKTYDDDVILEEMIKEFFRIYEMVKEFDLKESMNYLEDLINKLKTIEPVLTLLSKLFKD